MRNTELQCKRTVVKTVSSAYVGSCDNIQLNAYYCMLYSAFCVAGPVARNRHCVLLDDIRSAPTLSKICSRHICSLALTSLTNCFAMYEQRTLHGALELTLAMLLRLINCRCIIIIIRYRIRVGLGD